jgi:outer membrane protein
MNLRKTIAIISMSLISISANDAVSIDLTIDKLVKEVIKRNSSISIEALQERILQSKINYEEDIFTPKFFSNYTRTSSKTPNNTEEMISRSYLSTYGETTNVAEIGISGLLPTGATWSVSIKSQDKSSTIIDKYKAYGKEYENSTNLTLTQPILKNAGYDNTMIRYHLAKADKDIYESQFAKKMMDIIGSVIQTYWKFYGTQQLKNSWEKSLKITKKDLNIITQKYKAGDISYGEVLEAKSALLSKQAEFNRLSSKLEDIRSELFTLLNVSFQDNKNIKFNLLDNPKKANLENLNINELYRLTLKNWPEFKSLERQLLKEDLNIKNAKEQLQPELNLVSTLSSDTLDDERNKRFYDSKFRSWSVGLQFSTPLNYDKEKEALNMSLLKKKQLQTELSSLHKGIYNAVSTKLQSLNSSKYQLESYTKGLELKEESLTYDRKSFELGAKSIRDVLKTEEEIIDYKRKLYNAIIEWKISEATLQKAIGTLIDQFISIKDISNLSNQEYSNILDNNTFGKI